MQVHECVLTNEIVDETSRQSDLWDAIICPEGVKERVLHHALLALTVRPRLPFATTALHGLALLYGPPGTGKTSLARGLATRIAAYVPSRKARLIEVNPHGLMSAEHGQSQQRVSELLAEHIPLLADDGLPTVVVLDEVESMAVARSAASLTANPADVHRATDAVLTALDRIADEHPHVFVIATSNFTSALDEAFKSRADVAVEVPLPGVEALERILRSTLQTLADEFEGLGELVRSPELGNIAAEAEGLDGRRARKVIFEALAVRLETVVDPGLLKIDDLLGAVGASKREASNAAD